MLAAIFASLLLGVGDPANPLLNELLDKGLPVPQGPTLRLPPPLLKEGLSIQDQEAALKRAAGKNDFENFTKDTPGAPFTLNLNAVDDKGKRVGQTIDVYFLAFGKLDKVKKEDVLNQLIGTESKKGKNVGQAKILSAEQLRMRGIQSLNGPNVEERFACLDFLLLEKVKITGVTDNVKTTGPDWVALAMPSTHALKRTRNSPIAGRRSIRWPMKARLLARPFHTPAWPVTRASHSLRNRRERYFLKCTWSSTSQKPGLAASTFFARNCRC